MMMTTARRPIRQRTIGTHVLISSVLHVCLAAALLVAAAESGLPRLLTAEIPVLSVALVSQAPEERRPAAAATAVVVPVHRPVAPLAEEEKPVRPAERAQAREEVSVGLGEIAAPSAPEPRGAGSRGRTEYASAAGPARGASAGPVFTTALPRYRDNARPAYPLSARLRGYEGVVLLSVRVSVDGRVGDLNVKRSSGYDILDRSALEAVRTWTFEPARRMGHPVPMQVDVPVKFILRDEETLS